MSNIRANSQIRFSVLAVAILILLAGFMYYPKWKKSGSEATLSWDVSGYYLYLPATFIYKDLKQLKFYKVILEKYRPTPDFQQAYPAENGNKLLKYSSGMAVQFLPAFALSHMYAKMSDKYPADGYSRPYQLGIAIWGFIVAMIGLFFLAKILMLFFSAQATSLTLISFAFASNYLEYAGITNSMAHNYLFTLYAILIYVSIRFRNTEKLRYAIAIGFVCGLMALTRPTELIAVLIPILWGIHPNSIGEHLHYLRRNFLKIGIAVLLTGGIGMIQLMYWKYVSGSWLQYSYQDQGFSWLRPHLYNGLFHFRAGWLIYSPIMVFSLLGFYSLYKNNRILFWTIVPFSLLFIYIAFAWDIWWYGGSLGQRTMVQLMPVLGFSFAAIMEKILDSQIKTTFYFIFLAICVFLNFWITHHAHLGRYFYPEQMTQSFYMHVLGRNTASPHAVKLLDTKHIFEGFRKDVKQIYFNDFESDSTFTICKDHIINGQKSICLKNDRQYTPKAEITTQDMQYDWLRVGISAKEVEKEWSIWKNAQLIVELYLDGEKVDQEMIRLQRLLPDKNSRDLYIDIENKKKHNRLAVYVWHSDSNTHFVLDDLFIEIFNE